jgi:hypothetical protein
LETAELEMGMDWFWREDLWLPATHNWTHYQVPNSRGINYPQPHELLIYPLPSALILLTIRILFER